MLCKLLHRNYIVLCEHRNYVKFYRSCVNFSLLSIYYTGCPQKKVYSSFLGKRWSKCVLKFTSFTVHNAQTLLYNYIIWPSFIIIGHTNHTNHKTTSPGANVVLAKNRHVSSNSTLYSA